MEEVKFNRQVTDPPSSSFSFLTLSCPWSLSMLLLLVLVLLVLSGAVTAMLACFRIWRASLRKWSIRMGRGVSTCRDIGNEIIQREKRKSTTLVRRFVGGTLLNVDTKSDESGWMLIYRYQAMGYRCRQDYGRYAGYVVLSCTSLQGVKASTLNKCHKCTHVLLAYSFHTSLTIIFDMMRSSCFK